MAKCWQQIEIAELCKGVHCVDLGESFQTHIYLQNFVSIQPRTSPVKFAASREGFFGHYSQVCSQTRGQVPGHPPGAGLSLAAGPPREEDPGRVTFWQNFGKMLFVFGCIGTDFCKKIRILQHFSKSTRLSSCNFWNMAKFCRFYDICKIFADFSQKNADFSNRFFAKILRLQLCKRMQIL